MSFSPYHILSVYPFYRGSHSAQKHIKVVQALFAELKSHFIDDLYKKEEETAHKNGVRKTNHELYGANGLLPIHHVYTKQLFIASQAPLIVVWGKPARTRSQSEFGVECKAHVGDHMRDVVFLPHPERIARWSSHDDLLYVAQTIETMSLFHDIKSDWDVLQRHLRRTIPEAPAITITCSTAPAIVERVKRHGEERRAKGEQR
ncbi:hypothetical protein MMC13_005866 [Lambiella insularis]|nr:hypothetical protein [Lambiella insularis]